MKNYLVFLFLVCGLFCTSTTNAQYWCWVSDTTTFGEGGGSQGAATDRFGNIYCVSSIKRLVKHNMSDGSVDWINVIGGSTNWAKTLITTDPAGYVYAFYDSTGTILKISKIDSFGNNLWSNTTNLWNGVSQTQWSINADNLGHIFVSGSLQAEGVFIGTDSVVNPSPRENSFIIKLDTSGSPLWIKSVTSPEYVKAYGVATDLSGNLFIGGLCKSDTLTILDSTVSLGIGAGAEGLFVAKCDSNGHLLWVTASRHTNPMAFVIEPINYHLRVDDAGNAYFAGRFHETDTLGSIPIVFGPDNMFVAKYRGTDGNVLWAKTGGFAKHLYGFSTNPQGKSYLVFATDFASTTHFDTSTFILSPPSVQNSTIVGFDSSGKVICGYMLGGKTSEDDIGITVDQTGNAYVLGDIAASCNFGGINVVWPWTSEEYFLAKYTCNCTCGDVLGVIGGNNMCVGGTTTVTTSVGGGTWSSSNPSVVTITSSGVVTAVSLGTTIISYNTVSGCNGTTMLTVSNPPSIVSGVAICSGATNSATLTATPAGGTWSSSSSVAVVGILSGVVTGITGGTSIITYCTGSGCIANVVVTINSPIFSGGSVCVGSTLTLSSIPPGGTWTSTNPAIATVNPSSGVVTGVMPGTVPIIHSLGPGCTASGLVLVNPALPPGSASLCAGTTTTLTGSPAGGVWSSTNTSVATVGSTSGVVSAVAAGTVDLLYSTGAVCPAVTNLTVNALPGLITGKPSICEGFNTLLSCTPSGGTWSSSTAGIAIVNSSGTYTGIAPGTATITYMLPGGCFTTSIITVNSLPAVITGPTTVTVGSSITLTDATAGGSWSSGDVAKANVNSVGKVTGAGPGTVTIYYTLPTGCKQGVMINVVKSVSVTAVAKTAKPSLYPNPATNEMTIRAERSAFTSFTIYNAAGQEVATHEIVNQETTVNVKSFAPGEYQVVLNGEGVKEVLRFMKW